jgi:hypothetical protein
MIVHAKLDDGSILSYSTEFTIKGNLTNAMICIDGLILSFIEDFFIREY